MDSKHKVLVVDDSPIVCRMTQMALAKEGYEVTTTTDPAKAVTWAQSFQPDCIILDVLMPKINGYEVCMKLRSLEAFQDVPILMYTCKDSRTDVLEAHHRGADGYLLKPTRPDLLCERVARAIEEKRRG